MSAPVFGDPAAIRAAREYRASGSRRGRPWADLAGPGPADETCGTCGFLRASGGTVKTYFKCGARKMTRGPGTDVRKRDPSCVLWKLAPAPPGA